VDYHGIDWETCCLGNSNWRMPDIRGGDRVLSAGS
jgi:hypothetical protein